MTFGSLFAGIGGIDLGLERAGMECLWQVEIDDYCRRILAKHWPDVRRFEDVKKVHSQDVAHARGKDGRESSCPNCLPAVDLVCGGFPCQPHSVAGKRKGAEDDRNLWPDFIRVVAELRPRYVLAENVPGIITTYLDTVLSDLEGEGYTTATFNIPACAFDAPHRRQRIFVVARNTESDADCQERRVPQGPNPESSGICGDMAYAEKQYCDDGNDNGRCRSRQIPKPGNRAEEARPICDWWTTEPDVDRVAHGIPARVDRLKCLGNAVVPQVVELIGRAIMEAA